MAIHAAMVDRMDQEIGRLLEQLRAIDAYDDTVIFFLSDNGASAEIMIRGDGHDPCGGTWFRGELPLSRARLVERGQYAVPPAQDLGPRGGHCDAAHRALAARYHDDGSTAASGRACDRPRSDDAPAGRWSWPTEFRGQPVPPTPGCSLVEYICRGLPHCPARCCGGCTKAIARCELVIGSWSPRREIRGNCTTCSRDRAETHDRAADIPDRVNEMQDALADHDPRVSA